MQHYATAGYSEAWDGADDRTPRQREVDTRRRIWANDRAVAAERAGGNYLAALRDAYHASANLGDADLGVCTAPDADPYWTDLAAGEHSW